MRIFLFYILFLPLVSGAQVNVFNADLSDTSKKQLYLHAQNNLMIRSSQSSGQLKLVSTKSSAIAVSKNMFQLFPRSSGADTIRLFSGKKLIHTSVFVVDILPDLIVRVGGILDTLLTVKQVLLNPYLSVLFPGSNYKGKFNVFSFLLIIENSSGEVLSEDDANSNQFTAKQLTVIKSLQPGDKLRFPNTKGGGPDSRIQKFPPFTITIR